MNYAIARLGKLKGWGQVAAANGHNLRTRPTPNADQHRTALNEILHGSDDLAASIRSRFDDEGIKKPRKDAVLCSEMLLTGSPEAMAGMDIDRWKAKNLEWLRETYGPNLVQVVLHLDETTPHIHAMITPINPGGSLSAKKFWGEAEGLRQLQTDYATAMRPMGLTRGIEGSKAKHTAITAFYGALKAAEHPIGPGAMPERPRTEEKAVAGFVRAALVKASERGWRANLVRWGKAMINSEERARLAAAGLSAEVRALKLQRDETTRSLQASTSVLRMLSRLKKYCPDELAALIEKSKAKKGEELKEQRRQRAAERRAKAKEAEAAIKVQPAPPRPAPPVPGCGAAPHADAPVFSGRRPTRKPRF